MGQGEVSMKIKHFAFSLLLLAFLMFVGCQQNTTPTMPKAGVAQPSSQSVASTSTQADDVRSLKPDKKTSAPDVDQDQTGVDNANVDENDESHSSESEIAAAGEDAQIMSAVHDMRIGSDDSGEMDFNQSQDFLLRVSPHNWNKNWINSNGVVTVRIEGTGIEDIDPKTLQMSCASCTIASDPDYASPFGWKFDSFSLTVKFKKSDAIGLIAEPKRGETYEMLISFSMMNGLDDVKVLSETPLEEEELNLPFTISILGKKPPAGDLNLRIRPKKWNRAWANPDDEDNGIGDDDLITARIKGEGFDEVVPGSLLMSYGTCDSPASDTIFPVFEELGGTSYVAKFTKSDAIGLIEDPKRGQRHPIQVTGQLSSNGETVTFCLSYLILIHGKKSGEGPLTLEIKPKTWNMAWLESDEDGDVTARIKGEDFEKIDPATIWLVGPEGSIAPQVTEFAGFSFNAKFKQSAAIALIPNSPTQTSYDVQIIGFFKDGTTPLPATLTCEVGVKKKK